MKTIHLLRLIVGIVALWGAATASAQTTAASGTVIVLPNAANTTSFGNEVSVQNPNPNSITLDVLFYEATSSSSPGLHTCTQLTLGAGQSLNFQLVTQCSMTTPPNHHGMLILQDSATPKVNVFYAHGRLQTPFAIGYSVEGFPIGNFSGSTANVLGLKRTATGNVYQSNCFVGALGETLNYKIQLFDGAANTQIGSDITGTLSPFQMIRYLDIFTVAVAPVGDYNNVRARFSSTSGLPAMVAYCTVQESNHFNSDFRIARSDNALDQRQKRLVCYSSADCATADTGVGATQITSATTKNIHYLFITQPDFVQCKLVSPNLGDLEMKLRGPGDVFLAPDFVPSPPYDADPPYSAGGSTKTSFYIFTGYRNAVNSGTVTRWFIDVSFNEAGNSADLPVAYGIICNSGNGVSVPWFRAQSADDF